MQLVIKTLNVGFGPIAEVRRTQLNGRFVRLICRRRVNPQSGLTVTIPETQTFKYTTSL